ncbi:TonB-dependent receptor [Mucilaginibacter sp. PAMB04168]|uniref:SusC/RagA family TonB-linked outer membrane protein n=1 Tax=Mucilaginibacter sp. PAMB04168 TaxID=3138567 RepID=UPI0031F63709
MIRQLQYLPIGKRLCLLLLISILSIGTVLAQQVTVTGTVTDENGETVPGTTVTIRNKAGGTSVDVNGKYSIRATKGDVLVFKLLGYTDQEATVGDNPVVNIKFARNTKQLTDVVVIGYGTQKRGDVTGSVSSLKAGNIPERPVTRVDQALVGQIAGVTVRQTTGVPGKAFSVQVRGTGSISAGNEPLYVVDGFPLTPAAPNGSGNFATGNPLDNINPADIESIEVLKDAAAAAIYGSRASNGVVLITTRRGKIGKPVITYNAFAGYNDKTRGLNMLDGQGWIDRATEMINGAYVNNFGSIGAKATDTYEQRRQLINTTLAASSQIQAGQFNTAYMLDDRWAQPGHPGLTFVDWQKEAYRKALVQSHQLTASGGTENVKYFVSGAFNDQNGILRGLDYKAYSLRANVDVTASKVFKFGINISPSYSIAHDPGVEGKDNIFHQILSMTPVQEANAGRYANSGLFPQYNWSVSTNSPISKLENNVGETKRYRTLGTIYAEVNILKNLVFRTTLNLDNTDNTSSSYVPYINASSLTARLAQTTTLTSGTYNTFRHQTFVNENTLNYNATISKNHNLNLLAGYSFTADRNDLSTMSSSNGFSSSVIQTLSAANAITGGSSANKNTLESMFARAQYSFRSKYLFSASIRRDGSSRFAENNKYGYFPSASVGWRVTEENFAKKLTALSDLKLRYSYGEGGNYNIGNYSAISQIGLYNYSFNGASAIGQNSSNNPAADLRWEKSKTHDVGIDFGFFKNRLTGSVDYYIKDNTDLLLNVPTHALSGFTSTLMNAGSVRNKGLEIELTSQNFSRGVFTWSTSVNVSHNSNKVTALASGQSQLLIPSSFDIEHSILQVGQPLYSIYVVKQIGILSQQDIANNYPVYQGSTKETVGDPKYFDANGDGVIDANDRVIVGQPNPKWIWGFTNSFKYKNFDLSVLVQGQNGGSIYSLLGRALTRTGQGFTDNTPAFYENRWRSPSNPGEGRVSKAYSTFGRIANTDWLYSSDYWRVRNITLGYNLNNVIKKAKFISSARIYITAENFFGHDKYYGGLNPEANNTNLSGSDTYPEAGDYGGLPLVKSLVFGLNFGF